MKFRRPGTPDAAPPRATEVAKGTPAALVLSDGRAFVGEAIGAFGKRAGEVVFNTAMSGYQEVLTDPSYTGQFVTMTHPHIGNYGIQAMDDESSSPCVAGLVVKKLSRHPSHRRHTVSVGQYLAQNGLPGIEGIDTRALVRHIRTAGAQPAVLAHFDQAPTPGQLEELAYEARKRGHVPPDAAQRATAGRPYTIQPREWRGAMGQPLVVVAYDFGIKRGIVDQLAGLGCKVHVVPPNFPAEAALRVNPDGIFLSNGPGDPTDLPDAVEIIRGLVGKAPMFGICLGHQLLGLALGGNTEKMTFGHRGSNHPVKDLTTGHVGITSQNHGYTVIADGLPDDVEVTHINLNDGSVEGMRSLKRRFFSVQYHPEANPGPHDTHYHFKQFHRFMKEGVLELAH